VLLKPLPYGDGDRLVLIRQSAPLIGRPDVGVSIKELYDYREQAAAFDEPVRDGASAGSDARPARPPSASPARWR
jgi:hypothetical protein